ncbi:MAG: glycosyltransferase [Planctomycetota bacterium]
MPETPKPTPASIADRQPIGLIGPEWALRKSARGAALWRHAGVLSASRQERVEVLALDRAANGARFTYRDEWNIPAPGARFRVRRVNAGDRTAAFDELSMARLEGAALEWLRERAPRIVHVLGIDGFGPGVMLALEAADVPTVLTLERLRELKAAMEAAASRNPEVRGHYRAALSSARRIVVRSTADAAAAEALGAPREKLRVMKATQEGEMPLLRAFARLYRLLAPAAPVAADQGVHAEAASRASASAGAAAAAS